MTERLNNNNREKCCCQLHVMTALPCHLEFEFSIAQEISWTHV